MTVHWQEVSASSGRTSCANPAPRRSPDGLTSNPVRCRRSGTRALNSSVPSTGSGCLESLDLGAADSGTRVVGLDTFREVPIRMIGPEREASRLPCTS